MDMTLPKQMKALVAYGPGDYRLETAWPVPECGPDDIIIRTEGLRDLLQRLEVPARRTPILGKRDHAGMGRSPFHPRT